MNCFKVVDKSAGTQILADGEAALTAERKCDATPRSTTTLSGKWYIGQETR